MNTTKDFYKYLDNHPIGKMHSETKHSLLELYFVRDEKHFFEELIETYAFQLIVNDDFSHTREILDDWNTVQQKNAELIKNLLEHDKRIENFIDEKKSITEINYALWHKNILNDVEDHLANYRVIKSSIFDIIKSIMKKQKREKKQLLAH